LLAAARENIIPALILQSFALAVVLSFFYLALAKSSFEYVAQLKAQFGVVYAIVSTALFGGLLPFVFLCLKQKIKTQKAHHFVFYLVVWGFMGWLIDSFYQLQAEWFGEQADIITVVKKTLVDQFIFSVFITSPLVTSLYIWKESGFQWAVTRQSLLTSFIQNRLPATIISTWCIWLPAVCLIYTMPSSLQIPLFNLVLCFFVLIISALDRD
jgi:hypothetical protein